MGNQEENQKGNFSTQVLILQWIGKMTDAEAAKNFHEYYVFFSNALQLTMGHIQTAARLGVEQDKKTMLAAIADMRTKTPNDAEAKTREEMIRKDFADQHKFYIYMALNSLNLDKHFVEGLVDFNAREYEKIAAVIQRGEGNEATLKEVVKDVPKL